MELVPLWPVLPLDPVPPLKYGFDEKWVGKLGIPFMDRCASSVDHGLDSTPKLVLPPPTLPPLSDDALLATLASNMEAVVVPLRRFDELSADVRALRSVGLRFKSSQPVKW